MKTSRLVTYGLCGIIVGLLLENTALVVRQKVREKGKALKKNAGKVIHQR